MGIVLHLSYLATRSILIPMLIHFLNNSLIILSLSETGPVPILTSLDTAFQHSPFLALASSVLVLLAVGILLHRTRVRIIMPSGMESPSSLYPHVEIPVPVSSNRAVAGTAPMLEIGVLIVAI
jgi:membrane protease YdiL (CAAX protease family)